MLLLSLTLACAQPEGVSFSAAELRRLLSASPLPEPPADPTNAVADDPLAAATGQALFFDARLSANGEVSCSTCHDPEHGFSDDNRLSEGIGTTGRHAPSAMNSVYYRWMFWDGRADSHWCQALGPLESPVEHGATRAGLAHILYDDPEYNTAYTQLFGPLPDLSDTDRFPAQARPVADDPTNPQDIAWQAMDPSDQEAVNQIFANLGKMVAAYERLLVSGPSPFDDFAADLREGREPTLDESAQRGAKLFFGDAQCHLCHSGPVFSDFEFHNIGLGLREGLSEDDEGRYAGITSLWANPFNAAGAYSDAPTGEAAERLERIAQTDEQLGQFKTPSLRDVALFPPYMHGGHFMTLEEVVHHYNQLDERPMVGHRDEFLLPLDLDMDQVLDIVAFLESLSGEPLDDALLAAP